MIDSRSKLLLRKGGLEKEVEEKKKEVRKGRPSFLYWLVGCASDKTFRRLADGQTDWQRDRQKHTSDTSDTSHNQSPYPAPHARTAAADQQTQQQELRTVAIQNKYFLSSHPSHARHNFDKSCPSLRPFLK
jgi:hypothetical protein